MSEWKSVKWTEARQVAEALDLEPEDWPEPDVTPEAHFERLRAEQRHFDAIAFLCQALPRYEALAWVAGELNRMPGSRKVAPLERQTLDRVLRWIDEPTDEYRRAANDAAERARSGSAERVLGQAVFMSGGSIAPPDLTPVLPPQSACGRLASTALLIGCQREADAIAAMDQALDNGAKVARNGIEALAAA